MGSENHEENRFASFRKKHQSQIKDFKLTLHLLRKNPLSILGILLVAGFTVAAVLAPWIAPQDPKAIDLMNRLQPPSWAHLAGTDSAGRDILSMIIYGSQYDLQIAIIVALASGTIGSIVGVYSGFLGGKIDEILMRITDVFYSIPSLILALAVAAALGERGIRTLVLAISVAWWPGYARLVRAEAMRIRELEYVLAAKAMGASNWRIMFRHVLPNAISVIIVRATLDMGYIILTAASLSFVGFGAQPQEPEWGRMISDGRLYVGTAWWSATFPGIAIMLTVLAFNLLGDGLRDALDPKIRR